jgi:alpha-L-rhamnosidase
MKKIKLCLLLIIFGFLFANSQSLITVSSLKCEYETNPIGIESSQPRLSWILSSTARNQVQTACSIMVASSPEKLRANIGDLWDSKILKTSQSIQMEYAGKPLQPASTYYWKVKVWDNAGKESAWSETASWQMGLLSPSDWGKASWISLPILDQTQYAGLDKKTILEKVKNILPQFRKDFTVDKPIKNATAFISGLGNFVLKLNGQKVSDHFLDPGWTNYEKYSFYVTFDLTTLLARGNNTIGVLLGNGFYDVPSGRYRKGALDILHGLPKMICKILINYQDGSSQTIESDQSWKVTRSPITFSSVYGGEDFDATLEQEGWDKPSFIDTAWQQAALVTGNDILHTQRISPNKVMETLKPVKIFKSQRGYWIYDLGQNASGIVQFNVQGKTGDMVKIYPGELLDTDSSITQKATGSPYCFGYKLKGNGVESWQPLFSYYGFRYIQLEGGIPEGQENPQGLPVVKQLLGLHTRNAAQRVGDFSSSSELFNKTNTLIDWAIKSNLSSVVTDCPHREKLGWLEQTYLMGPSIFFNYDVPLLFTKTIDDMQSCQLNDGMVPAIAPEYCIFNDKDGKPGMFRDSPEWGSAYVILPWYLYQWYGDKKLLSQNYEGMKNYVDYLQSKSVNYIISFGLGDWYDLGPKHPGVSQLTSLGVTGTATWYYDATIMASVASLLGKKEDMEKFKLMATKIREAFNKTYFHKETATYDQNSQAANAMAIYMGLVEPQDKEKVLQNLIKDIRSRNNALTAGDIGYRYVLRALEEESASDVIFDMNSRSDVPGYGYQLNQGATALTESWQALHDVSNNHLMLGHLMEWLYSGLAGIRQPGDAVAYKSIIIKPEIVGNITGAKASYQSMYGTISSEWKKQGNAIELNIQIPVNTTATVYLPGTTEASVTEGGKKPGKDIRFLRKENGRLLYTLGSGSYAFKVTGK